MNLPSISPGQGSALGAVADIGGGIGGAIASARQAAKQRDFVKWQMRNKYQLQMADMEDAGLNPILAANAQPNAPGTGMARIDNVGRTAATSAKAGMLARKQGELIDAQKHQANSNAARAIIGAMKESYGIPEAATKAEWYGSPVGRMMTHGKMGSDSTPQWYRPSSYIGYGAGAGWSSANELQKFMAAKSGYRKDKTAEDDFMGKLPVIAPAYKLFKDLLE